MGICFPEVEFWITKIITIRAQGDVDVCTNSC